MMTKYIQTLKERRSRENGYSLIEVMVAVGIISLILWLSLPALINGPKVVVETEQAFFDNASFQNAYQLMSNDRRESQNFSALPGGGDVVEFYGWDYNYVRWQFVPGEDGKTVLTRQESTTPAVRDYGEPVVKAQNVSGGQFTGVGDELHITIGDETLMVLPSPVTHIPIGNGGTVIVNQERANTDHMLQQDVQLALNKDGSTEQLLILELEDGSFVYWQIDGSRIKRSTSPSLGAPFVDERVMMTGASNARFSYDFYATRDITLVVDGHETVFTIPLRAPNITQ